MAPHLQSITILNSLFDRLWQQFRARVSYADRYATLVEQKGGRVANDHIAFRTFDSSPSEAPGITGMARIFEALGYARRGEYTFTEKKLFAIHLEHEADPSLPKIFISELQVKKLSSDLQALIAEVTKTAKPLFSPNDLASSHVLFNYFTRPWDAPTAAQVQKANKESQYAAWTLLHGNAVNHFTAFVNGQNVPEWGDIEGTIAALRKEGIPMKETIEGERGTKLRQSSTEAVMLKTEVKDGMIDWPYAYYEIAERNPIDGTVYQGFLGEQATHLFEMTKKKE